MASLVFRQHVETNVNAAVFRAYPCQIIVCSIGQVVDNQVAGTQVVDQVGSDGGSSGGSSGGGSSGGSSSGVGSSDQSSGAGTWKQVSEASGPTRAHRHVSDPGEGVKGEDLSRKHLTTLNRLRTWVGRYKASMKKWGLADSAACECGEPEQTADHIINSCPLPNHHP